MAEALGVQTSDREALANAFYNAFNKMNVLELVQLTQALEERFGVSVGPANVSTQGPTTDTAPAVAEKTHFEVHLKGFKDKIPTVKLVKELFGFGLKESMDMIAKVPCVLKSEVEKNIAEDALKRLQELGCDAELK